MRLNVKILKGRGMKRIFLLLISWGWLVSASFGQAGELASLQGVIVDVDGQAVGGAEVYAYDSPNVKRPADFVSNRTAVDGSYRLQLPAGSYWLVAIYRHQGGRFGPLAIDDRHSGEPVAVDLISGRQLNIDFTVADLREAASQHHKKSADLVMVEGMIVDPAGRPLSLAYVMADRRPEIGGVPHYISTWTDSTGRYTLYLPAGRFYFGAATRFPPENGYILPKEVVVEEKTTGVDIAISGNR